MPPCVCTEQSYQALSLKFAKDSLAFSKDQFSLYLDKTGDKNLRYVRIGWLIVGLLLIAAIIIMVYMISLVF